MKLILDNQPVELRESEDASLRRIIERVSEELKERNRVISEIYVDGKMMGGWDDPNMKDLTVGECEHMRLISEAPRKLAHKVLYDIAGFMPNIQNALIETSEKIQSRQEEEGMKLLEEVSSTWAELYTGLQNAITVTGLDYSSVRIENKSFLEINDEIHQYLNQVSDLVSEQQFLELSDILEYEIAPRIPMIQEGIYRLIKELEKKPN